MDKRLSPLLNMAVFIETKCNNLGHTDSLYDKPNSGHQQIRKQLNDIFESDEFTKVGKKNRLIINLYVFNILTYFNFVKLKTKVREGFLGTHSLRKGSATFASRTGIPRDFVNK